jgi:DNA anti-recombination protein RmuC
MEEIKVGSIVLQEETEASGEDMLLQQIDAFRDKAKQIQTLLVSKEQRVKELEAMVREKEERNAELQEELEEKQRQADGLVSDVEHRVDRAMDEMHQTVDEMEKRITEQVLEQQKASVADTQSLQGTVTEMSECLETMKGELSEKVHSENVKQYRNIQDLLKEMDKSEETTSLSEAGFSNVKSRVTLVSFLVVADIIVTVCMWLSMIGII